MSLPISTVVFETVSDLRLQAGTGNVPVVLLGLSSVTDNNGGNYMWNPTSTVADDGFKTIQVTGVSTGRWVRLINSNTLKGSSVFSSVSLQTAYNISFGTTFPFIPAMVLVQAYSPNAGVSSWVSNVTTTGFTVNFASVPLLGTLNLTVYWLVIKA